MSLSQKVDLMCDLYPERKNPDWPTVELRPTRDALKAAEAFRNAVVHSFWYLGPELQWMRTKASLRSKGQLSISAGKVRLDTLEEGGKCLYILRDWYLGRTDEIANAAERLKVLIGELSAVT